MRNEEPRENSGPVEGRDFYREGAFVIFTAAYHLRRGSCCANGCRHCPYREAAARGVERDDEKLGG